MKRGMKFLLFLILLVFLTGLVSAECVDLDGGKNYYKAGEIIKGEIISKDLCLDSRLVEFYCQEGEKEWSFYNCSMGCREGACLRENNKTCDDLWSLSFSFQGNSCKDKGYNPAADINKDGRINIFDLNLIVDNRLNYSWCKERWENTKDPCFVDSCKLLWGKVRDSFGKTCWDDYDAFLDVDKDKLIAGEDLLLIYNNRGNKSWCEKQEDYFFNPCLELMEGEVKVPVDYIFVYFDASKNKTSFGYLRGYDVKLYRYRKGYNYYGHRAVSTVINKKIGEVKKGDCRDQNYLYISGRINSGESVCVRTWDGRYLVLGGEWEGRTNGEDLKWKLFR